MRSLRFLCPNGHLGFAPLMVDSFELGVATRPDFILADSGSDDIGPGPLGHDVSTSPLEWQVHDLEHMLLAARRLGVPMIIGSAGDTGSNSRVDLFVGVIRDLARKHGLAPFKLGWFYSEVDKDYLRAKIRGGDAIHGLEGRSDLLEAELDATERVVAVAGVHPYLKLLEAGAEVIIGGRSSDAAIFAAPAIHAGFAEAESYYLGKVLECASFCAEPYGAKETVIGTISDQDVQVTAMAPFQRCTVASVAGHAMYERTNPYHETVAGGVLDMRDCVYEQLDERTVRVTQASFHPATERRVKLEGSAKVGERFVGMAGIRDPYTIAHVDEVLAWSRQKLRERFGEDGYEVHFNVFGRDGVMGDLEPFRDQPGHELCVVVQGIAPSRKMAEEVAMIATRQMFYARLPDVKGTAGGAAFLLDEVLPASPAYRWSLNHTVRVDDYMELFPTHLEEVVGA